MEPGRVSRRDIRQRPAPRRRQDMTLDGHAAIPRRPRLAARRDMILRTEFHQVGDGGFGRQLRRLRFSPRLMRSMAAASWRRSSTVLSPTDPGVARFRPVGPLDRTTRIQVMLMREDSLTRTPGWSLVSPVAAMEIGPVASPEGCRSCMMDALPRPSHRKARLLPVTALTPFAICRIDTNSV